MVPARTAFLKKKKMKPNVQNVHIKSVGRPSHQQRAICEVRGVWPVLLFGLRMTCQQSMLEVMSSVDENDITSSDEEGEHNAWNFLLGSGWAASFGHAGERCPRERSACEDSS